ncbi:MAG: CotH kinase family protein [Bacteroidales bacterium]
MKHPLLFTTTNPNNEIIKKLRLLLFALIAVMNLSFSHQLQAQTTTIDPPVLNLPSGYYTSGQVLEIHHADPDAVIYYTLDGALPTTASIQYTGAVTLEVPAANEDDISLIRTNPVEADLKGFGWVPPVEQQPKAFIITAIAVKEQNSPSPAVRATYFVDIDIPSLPVISIIMDPLNLFDHHKGIYIPGIVYEQYGYGEGYFGQPNANYFRREDEYEIPSGFEFFEEGLPVIQQVAGVEIHGGTTRAMPMKSLRIIARSEYGKATLKHQVFPDQQRDNYKRLILRNGGQDFYRAGTLMRDAMLHKLGEPLKLAIQDYRPAIVYLNGHYWGIHNIRERYDSHYFERKYQIPEGQLDLLENKQVVQEGSSDHYQAMLDFIQTNPLTDPQAYATLQTMMDTDNYIDYFVFNVFVNNIDWPGHNLKLWRKKVPYQPHAAWGHDGRWRWSPYDMDFALGRSGSYEYKNNTLAFATDPDGSEWPPNLPWSTFLIRNLLDNDDFKQAFIARFADALNTILSSDHLLATISQSQQNIEAAMPDHLGRWSYPATDLNEWKTNVNILKTFAVHRPSHQTEHILEYFGLSGTFQITVDANDPAMGTIQVNQLVIDSDNPMLINSGNTLPWAGTYFNDVSFPVTALPAEGFVFTKWITTTGEELTDNPLIITSSQEVHLQAVFEPAPVAPYQDIVLHHWHFNNLPDEVFTSVAADYSFSGNATITYPGTGAGYLDMVDDGSTFNLQPEQQPGNALRVRNPSNTRHLELLVPSTGYENLQLSYAVKRTPNGAQQQALYYREQNQASWNQYGEIISVNEDYGLVTFDLSALPGANNNPELALRLEFLGTNTDEVTGNNRFDNIQLTGTPVDGTNIPPLVAETIPLQVLTENGGALVVDASGVFTDDNPMTFSAVSTRPDEVAVSVQDNLLTLTPLKSGDALVRLSASDGTNAPVTTEFRALVYPEAFAFDQPAYVFARWDAEAPERSYPPHMIFLQSDTDDPGLSQPLSFPYYIDHSDYHADDQGTIGYPYNNTGRSRINGLNDNGISLINTGRDRDLGGVLLAVNTQQQASADISFLAGTIAPNSRVYNLRLQYRVGTEGAFKDVTDDSGNIVEYPRNAMAGHTTSFQDIPLPQEAQGQPYIQLLWRYYYTGEQLDTVSGQRAEIRLDNIQLGEFPSGISEENSSGQQLTIFPNPAATKIQVQANNLEAGTLSWRIINIQGNILMEHQHHQTAPHWHHELDISHLPNGVYLLQIISRQGVISKTFIKSP